MLGTVAFSTRNPDEVFGEEGLVWRRMPETAGLWQFICFFRQATLSRRRHIANGVHLSFH